MAPGYEYVELAQAVERVGRLVNLWAIVAECSMPRSTRGTDMVCNLTLVDPSTPEHPELTAGVELLCFAPTPEELPHVKRPGDIIRLHRVRINRYNNRPQLFGKMGPRGPNFAYCVFSAAGPAGLPPAGADPNPRLLPYQASSLHYHWDEREGAMLQALRRYQATCSRAQMGGSTAYLRRICDVRPRFFFDCVCRVLAVDDSDPELRLLYIWDASDVMPCPIEYDTRADESHSDPRQQQQHQERLRSLRPFALPLEDMADLSSLPLLGTALPLLFPKSGGVEQPAAGSWVKMRNVGARVVAGQLQAFFQRNSRWTPLQDEAKQREVEEEYTQRLEVNHVAAWAPDPWGSTAAALMSRSRHAHRPFNTVRQVLLDTPTAAPRCYRLLARLMDYSPRDPAEMCHQAAQCGLPGTQGKGRWVYTLKFLVEDATGQLDVILFGPDGDAFFSGMPAQDMRADEASAARLLHCLECLRGVGCDSPGGPWMDLSIRTYFTDPAHPWHSRQYRVCDTTITLPQLPAADAAGGQ